MKKRSQSSVEKGIIICADDYAQNAMINAGILSLLKEKRINAASCLVNSSLWDEAANELEPFKASSFFGLHLNFTDGQPLSSMWRKHEGEAFEGLAHLLKRIYLRRLRFDVVKAEISAQLNVFAQMMHCYPDFIDGHQHIHQFPIIRDALFALYTEQNLPVFMRHTYNNWSDFTPGIGFPKKQLLACLGGQAFRRKLIQLQIATNTSFAGIYRFSKASRYRYFFKQFLAHSQHGGLIMCHPGAACDDQGDPIFQARPHELHYFLSDVFLTDLEDNSFHLLKKVEC